MNTKLKLNDLLRLIRLKGAAEDAPLEAILVTLIKDSETGSLTDSELNRRYQDILAFWLAEPKTLQ